MNTVKINQVFQHQTLDESFAFYESILSNISTSKQAWIQLLQYNGINYIWQEALDFLLQSESDLQEWNNYWNANIDDLIANISDYRQYRIAKSHVDLSLT